MLKCFWLPHSRMELDSTSGDVEPLWNGLIGHPEGPVLEDQAVSVRLLLEGSPERFWKDLATNSENQFCKVGS